MSSPVLTAVRTEWLFEGSAARIGRWRCEVHDSGLTPERVVAWHQIAFLDRGAFLIHSAGKTEVVDQSGALIHSPAEGFRTSHPFGLSDRGSFLAVPRETFLESRVSSTPFLISHGRPTSRAYLRQRGLLRRLRQAEPAEPIEIEEEALAILADVVSDGEAPRSIGDRNDGSAASLRRRRIAEEVREMFARGFRRPQRLARIAAEVGISPYYLCRAFKSETGVTLHSYLNRLRLRAAFIPAADPSTDLARLAMELGFSSHSHFTAAFRKEFGVVPADLRRCGSALGIDRKSTRC